MTILVNCVFILMQITCCCCQPAILSVQYYDQFDEDVSMAYTGGYLVVECQISNCEYTANLVDLVNELGKPVDSVICQTRVLLRLNITQGTRFGTYECRHGNLTSKHIDFSYRFCSPLDAACGHACRKHGNEYCIVKQLEPNPCIMTEEDFPHYNCEPPDVNGGVYCGAEPEPPIEVPQPRSLCEAHSAEKLRKVSTRVFDPSVTTACRHVEWAHKQPKFWYKPYPILYIGANMNSIARYNSITDTDPDRKMLIRVPRHYFDAGQKISANCTLNARNGKVLFTDATNLNDRGDWDEYYNWRYIEPFKSFRDEDGIDVYKLQCEFRNSQGFLMADIRIYVVHRSGIAMITLNKSANGQYVRALKCEPGQKLSTQYVIKSYTWWYRDDKPTERYKGKALENHTPEIVPEVTGYYRCVIEVIVKCSKPPVFWTSYPLGAFDQESEEALMTSTAMSVEVEQHMVSSSTSNATNEPSTTSSFASGFDHRSGRITVELLIMWTLQLMMLRLRNN